MNKPPPHASKENSCPDVGREHALTVFLNSVAGRCQSIRGLLAIFPSTPSVTSVRGIVSTTSRSSRFKIERQLGGGGAHL